MDALHAFPLIVALACLSCGPDGYSPPKWTPIDLAALEAEMNAPTGTLDTDTAGGILNDLIGDPARNSILGFASAFISKDGAQEEEDTGAQTGENSEVFATRQGPLEATAAAWIRISCPGPNLESPLTDFSAGSVQLDGNSIGFEGTSGPSGFGDILLQFADCQLGDSIYAGLAPGVVDPENNTGGLRLNLTVTTAGNTTPLSLNILVQDNMPRFEMNLPDLGSYTIGLLSNVEPLTFEVHAKNGVFSCVLTDQLRCTAPGAGTITVTP
jgi:hypothetical protein